MIWNAALTYLVLALSDTINSGDGADTITLGLGTDYLSFDSVTQSAVGNGDTVTDYNANADLLIFSGFLTGTFSFIGAGAFTGGGNSQANFNDTTKLLSVDTNGDGLADMQLTLNGVSIANLGNNDFLWS